MGIFGVMGSVKASLAKSSTSAGLRTRCSASNNGYYRNGTATATRDMFIADLDMSRDETYAPVVEPMSVPDNTGASQNIRLANGSPRSNSTDMVPAADVQSLQMELNQARSELASQSVEVDQLRGMLADRERSLQLTKSELIETRMVLQEKEELLDEAYDRLRRATHERSEYRRCLLEAEQELQITRANLLEWSQGLLELRGVMEGLDEDLSDLVGSSTYLAAMAEMDEVVSSDGDLSLDDSSLEGMDQHEVDAITAALKDLQKLSAEVLHEAKEDGEYFTK